MTTIITVGIAGTALSIFGFGVSSIAIKNGDKGVAVFFSIIGIIPAFGYYYYFPSLSDTAPWLIYILVALSFYMILITYAKADLIKENNEVNNAS